MPQGVLRSTGWTLFGEVMIASMMKNSAPIAVAGVILLSLSLFFTS
jgi:hypothetical protein